MHNTPKHKKQGLPHKVHHGAHQKASLPQGELSGIIRLTAKGFGYVDIPEREEDIEIAPELLGTALHRDTVKIVLKPGMRYGRMQGEVIEVVERSKTRFVGTLEEENGFLFVRPDDHRVYMDFILERTDDTTPPPLGQKVSVDLVRWSSPKKNPLVRLVEVLGPMGEHETEMRSIVAGQGFDYHFPPEVERQAEEIEATKKEFFEKEIARRKDFRGTTTFTIDPADAKDFDDAISIRELPNGHIELGVHIADVSAYLTPGSPMDLEAQKRATSIYLVDRTIPMLPEALSNDLCSLVPHQDRLAMSAVFEMSIQGDVYEMWYGETVINSDRRFSYQDAQEILNAGRGEHFNALLTADTIARNLREARFRNGSIGFETDEIKFELDQTGKPIRAFRKTRLDTMLMIEDLMLLANREVATWIANRSKGKSATNIFVWRIHDTPKVDRIIELSLFLKALGYDLPHKNGIVSAKDINKLFAEIEDAPERDMIETSTIRSMAKAIYSTKNIGHFGLAFDYYTHFTSPIRRYPDVMVHRIVKSHLSGTPVGPQEFGWYSRMCAQSTEREIAAMEAERDSIKLKQVEFMAQHIGEEFDGVINGINDWGIFIEESTTMAEGLVRTNTLRDDYYELADHGFRLVGQKKKRTLSLGDKVRIRLKGVDIERKTIDWELIATA
jgi:ribonuclease R